MPTVLDYALNYKYRIAYYIRYSLCLRLRCKRINIFIAAAVFACLHLFLTPENIGIFSALGTLAFKNCDDVCPEQCWIRSVDNHIVHACKDSACAPCMFCKSIASGKSCPDLDTGRSAKFKGDPTQNSRCACGNVTNISGKFEQFSNSKDWCAMLTTETLHRRAQLRGIVVNSMCYHVWLAKSRNEVCGRGFVANMLIFSLGFDSKFWLAINKGGRTRFIENSHEWASMQPDAVKASTLVVRYSAVYPEADAILCKHHRLAEFKETQLPTDVKEACWDVILVDAPAGCGWKDPARMQSIYAARALSHDSTVVYTDDCQRRVESMYTLEHLHTKGDTIRVLPNGHDGYTCIVAPTS